MSETTPISDDEVDLTLHTAERACETIMEDESREEYFAGFCEDAIPMLRRIRDRLLASEAEVTSLRRALEEMTTDRDYHRAEESRLRTAAWEWGLTEPPGSEVRVAASEMLFGPNDADLSPSPKDPS